MGKLFAADLNGGDEIDLLHHLIMLQQQIPLVRLQVLPLQNEKIRLKRKQSLTPVTRTYSLRTTKHITVTNLRVETRNFTGNSTYVKT